MSEVWQRITIALALALAGCLITYILTTSSQKIRNHAPDDQPIAVLVSSENEVQRRPSERLVWRRVFDNQLLYAGEAIRTEAGAIATLEFINKKTTVQLEPDTVIEIDNDSKGLNLDFLKGNIFIRSENPLTLNSAGRKLEFDNAELSMEQKNGKLQVEVSKGKVNEVASSPPVPQIDILKPGPRETWYVEPEEKHSVEIQWNKLPPEYQISLETGSSPQTLSKFSEANAAAGANRIEVQLPAGRHYFRLVAIDVNSKLPPLYSLPRRIELRPKLAPILLEPIKNGTVYLPTKGLPTKSEIDFRWANPGKLENIIIEFARSQDLRVDYGSEPIKTGFAAKIPFRWTSGEIFWRVSGSVPNSKDAISSKISKFTLQTGEAPKVAATPIPTPVVVAKPSTTPSPSPSPSPSPTATPSPSPSPTPKVISPPVIDEAIRKDGVMGQIDGSAQVSWRPVSQIKEYQIEVRNQSGELIEARKVRGTNTTLTNLKTGNYTVSVNSVDQAGDLSAEATEIKIKIPEYSSVRAPKIKSLNIK